jgi:hypothetical protein
MKVEHKGHQGVQRTVPTIKVMKDIKITTINFDHKGYEGVERTVPWYHCAPISTIPPSDRTCTWRKSLLIQYRESLLNS